MPDYKLVVNPTKPKKLVICLPGSSFSGKFVECLLELINYLATNNIQFVISRGESPVVYYARNMCLGGDNLRGEEQKPFNGTVEYTHMLWIDSDIIFSPNHVQVLLNHDKDIVSGVYLMADRVHYASVEVWDEDYFVQHGSFKFLSPKDLENKKDLIDVAYTGFGFMLVKKGVFESLNYPWFRPIFYSIKHVKDFSSEDSAFCRLVREKGYKVYIDPQLRVGHEKKIVI
jgi:hypothetical protein